MKKKLKTNIIIKEMEEVQEFTEDIQKSSNTFDIDEEEQEKDNKNECQSVYLDDTKLKLNNKWALYLHNTNKWTKDSYHKIYEFNTIPNFCKLINHFPDFRIGSFYLMKDGCFPSWEDDSNKKGCRWSYSIDYNENRKNDKVYKAFSEVCMYAVGCTMFDDMDILNGIEVQLKLKYNKGLIKVWFRKDFPNQSPLDKKIIPFINEKDILYLGN